MHRLPRLVLLTASCLASPVSAEALRWPAPLLPEMESLPRLVENDPAARKINADLERIDQQIRDDASPCRAKPKSWWYRDTKVSFASPGFLSLEAFNDVYCDGSAHPFTFLETPTYVLATGEHVNWRQLLPANLLAPQPQRFDLAVIKGSAQMVTLYLLAIPDAPEECRNLITAEVSYFRLWLSEEAGGLMVLPDDLPHANRACGDPALFTEAMLAEIGASPALTNALAALLP